MFEFIDREDPTWQNVNAVRTMLKLAHVTAKPGLRLACYLAAGQHLRALRKNRAKAEWANIVQRECPVSVSRAYELIAIADGRKSVADVRSANAARVRTNYRKRSKAYAKRRMRRVPIEQE
jgi:hypothetical protein